MEEETVQTQTATDNGFSWRQWISPLIGIGSGSVQAGVGTSLILLRESRIEQLSQTLASHGVSLEQISQITQTIFRGPNIFVRDGSEFITINPEIIANPHLLIEFAGKHSGEILASLGISMIVISSALLLTMRIIERRSK